MARKLKTNIQRIFVPIINASGIGTGTVDGRYTICYPNGPGEVQEFGFIQSTAGVGTALVTISVEKAAAGFPGTIVSNTAVLDLDSVSGTRVVTGTGNGTRFAETDRLVFFFDFDAGTATTQAFILAYVDLVL